MQKISNFFKNYWFFILLAVLTLILRIYKIEELFYFTYDESIPAFVARKIILWQQIPLIGGATPLGFHLGPYFYWFYALILWIGKLDPISWGYASAFLSLLSVTLIFFISRVYTNKSVAATASVIWTFSYLTNVYDRHLWALFWGPLFTLLVLIATLKIISGKRIYIYLLFAVLAASIHADLSNLVFFIFTTVVYLLYKIKPGKETVIGVVIILLSFLPLLVFDLRHNFSNTKPFLEFVLSGSNSPSFSYDNFKNNALIFPNTLTRLVYTFGDNEIAKQYSYCKNFVTEKYAAIPSFLTLVSSFTIIYFVWWSFKRNSNNIWRLVSILFSIYFISIQLYGTIFKADVFEHYIAGALPIFAFIFAKILTILPRKIWLIFLSIFIFLNLFKISSAQNSHGLKFKREAINFTMSQITEEPFSLESLSSCWYYSGYRYLFTSYAVEPVKSYVDPNFSHLYGNTQVAKKHPQNVAAFVIHDNLYEGDPFYKRYALFKSHQKKSSLFGNIEVIIMDNSSDWF